MMLMTRHMTFIPDNLTAAGDADDDHGLVIFLPCEVNGVLEDLEML